MFPKEKEKAGRRVGEHCGMLANQLFNIVKITKDRDTLVETHLDSSKESKTQQCLMLMRTMGECN